MCCTDKHPHMNIITNELEIEINYYFQSCMRPIQIDNSNGSTPTSSQPMQDINIRIRRQQNRAHFALTSRTSNQNSQAAIQNINDSFSFDRDQGNFKSANKKLKVREIVTKKKLNKGIGQKKPKPQIPEVHGTIANYRLNRIQTQFISKLKRNSVFRQPIQFEEFAIELKCYEQAHMRNGLIVDQKLVNLFEIVNIMNTIVSCMLASFIIPFTEILQNGGFLPAFSAYGALYTAFQIAMRFTIIRNDEQNLTKLIEIAKNYLRSSFAFDFLCFLAFLLCAFMPIVNISWIYIIFFFKVPALLRQINEIQAKIIANFKLQHYFSLFKLIICNFTFAHIIAIIMLMMSHFEAEENWLKKSNFTEKIWWEQYSWAYYWGMTTMLSVGFGDISVANYKEALVLTIIEAFGYITLAYNITCVINLINSLEEKETWKNRNISLLKKIKSKSQIETGIYQQLTNFIKESHEIDLKFNRQPIVRMLEKLPQNLKNGFLRSVNEKSVKNLPFFCYLTPKSILNIAEKIETKVAHPQELLITKQQISNKIMILKQGEIGLFPYFGNQNSLTEAIKCQAFDRFFVRQGESAKLFNLNFLRPFYATRNYQYKSIKYSLLLQMDLFQLLEILRGKSADIEQYYQLRDKDTTNFEEFETIICKTCTGDIIDQEDEEDKIESGLRITKNNSKIKQNEYKNKDYIKETNQQKDFKSKLEVDRRQTIHKHSKFQCCRLHYCPLPQQIIFKYLHRINTQTNRRQRMSSLKLSNKVNISALKQYKYILECTNELTNTYKTALRSLDATQNQYLDYLNVCEEVISDDLPKMPSLSKLQVPIQPLQQINPQPISSFASNVPYRDYEQLDNFQRKNGSILASLRKRIGSTVQSAAHFWDVQCDVAHDFRSYFTAYNPKRMNKESLGHVHTFSNRKKLFFNS